MPLQPLSSLLSSSLSLPSSLLSLLMLSLSLSRRRRHCHCRLCPHLSTLRHLRPCLCSRPHHHPHCRYRPLRFGALRPACHSFGWLLCSPPLLPPLATVTIQALCCRSLQLWTALVCLLQAPFGTLLVFPRGWLTFPSSSSEGKDCRCPGVSALLTDPCAQ